LHLWRNGNLEGCDRSNPIFYAANG
jgi:hypothetical protein